MTEADKPTRPYTLLIGALGGEGGGVLANWIVNAARATGLLVQGTSIPGVAQRTGTTTYYIEIWPEPAAGLGEKVPVLSLNAAVGEVDMMVASELLEAGRAIVRGFVTPDRTCLVASTHRVYSTPEKMVMGDGRFEAEKLIEAATERSRERLLFDMDEAARQAGSMINAVMLGAIAGCGRSPIPLERFEAAIRDEGKAVEANLRGFRLGVEAAPAPPVSAAAGGSIRATGAGELLIASARADTRVAFPEAVHEVLDHAVARLLDYQDASYLALYLERLAPFKDGDAGVLAAVARNLAVRMTFEDIIRVAQEKARPQRVARIRAETGADDGEPVMITEYFKPGIAEVCDVLPERVAGWLLARAERMPRLARWSWPMRVKTSTVSGFARVWLLSRLTGYRRRTHRFRGEQRAIAAWLGLIGRAADLDAALACEVAECARLVKGYGETHRRGAANFARICEALVEPALAGDIAPGGAAAAIAEATKAALGDPDGAALANALATRRGTADAATRPRVTRSGAAAAE